MARAVVQEHDTDTLIGDFLRFSMPSALCSYCIGQTKIDESFASGNLRRIRFVDR